jgi:phospholipase C
MRRSIVLVPLFVASAIALAPACSSSSASGDAGDDAADASADLLVPPPIPRTQTEADLAPKRAACAFGPGAWPAETIGVDYPVGADIPIDHVIVIMQENRSFDHYLGRLVAQGYYQASELDAPPPGWSNPDGSGGTVVPHADDAYCFTANHSWNDMHDDWDNGQNDHFVTNNDPNGQKSFYYEDDTVIPFYYALANTFSVGDRYFASVMSSTWPNRFFFMAATSFGIGDNSFDTLDTAEHPSAHLMGLLDQAGRTWRDYTDGPHQIEFFPYYGFQHQTLQNLKDMKCALLTDIQNDTLPDVAIVMGSEVGETSDEGPSALPGIGGEMIEGLLRALFASPAWAHTAVFFTYDENGGTADHVPPAAACPPDSLAPHDGKGTPLDGAFDHTGFRVPFIVVSPYAKKHFVSHAVYDHTSITRFIEARFGLPALTARDANALPPMDVFDFKNPPFMTPPNITATTTVPASVLSQCGQTEVKLGCP